METHIDSQLPPELFLPNGESAEKLWQEGRRESSHETILAEMLAVYRQNCDLRENVNKLLQIIQEKDQQISQMGSIRAEQTNTSSDEKSSERLELENEQLKAANENIIRRYNEMDNMADRHYDEPCTTEDKPLPKNELNRLPYFHGKIGRRAAESLLEFRSEGDFLIRNCDMSLTDYTLSVKLRDGIRHFLVRTSDNKVFLGVNAFAGWIHLVEFHRYKSLLNTNYRRLTLQNPINK